MATRPASLPRWATDGGTTVEPLTAERDSGFVVDNKPPARKMNHLLNSSYLWHDLHNEQLRARFARKWVEFIGAPSANNFQAAAWKDDGSISGRWVIAGSGGKIYYTDDNGASLTAATAGGSFAGEFFDTIYSVAASGFIAAGALSLQFDADGAGTWTEASTAATFRCLAEDGTTIAVAGSSGGNTVLYTSTNGTTWTSRTLAYTAGDGAAGLAYGGGVWVLVDKTGRVQTATDPTGTWTDRGALSIGKGSAGTRMNSLTYAESIFVAAGSFWDTTKKFAWTSDGITWTDCTYTQATADEPDEEGADWGEYQRIAQDPITGLWIAHADFTDGRFITSEDGKAWYGHGGYISHDPAHFAMRGPFFNSRGDAVMPDLSRALFHEAGI